MENIVKPKLLKLINISLVNLNIYNSEDVNKLNQSEFFGDLKFLTKKKKKFVYLAHTFTSKEGEFYEYYLENHRRKYDIEQPEFNEHPAYSDANIRAMGFDVNVTSNDVRHNYLYIRTKKGLNIELRVKDSKVNIGEDILEGEEVTKYKERFLFIPYTVKQKKIHKLKRVKVKNSFKYEINVFHKGKNKTFEVSEKEYNDIIKLALDTHDSNEADIEKEVEKINNGGEKIYEKIYSEIDSYEKKLKKSWKNFGGK